MKHEAQEDYRKQKLWNKDFNKLPLLVKEYEQKQKEIEERITKKRQEIAEEKKRQEETGIVTKPT